MSPHVLIADDDPGVRSGLEALCRARGHTVTTADSGASTVTAAQEEPPDVVLLDIHMPQGSGLEVLPRLLGLQDAPAVVVMTALADVETAVEAMRSGASDFLEKPVRAEVLDAAFERILNHQAVVRERNVLRSRVTSLLSGPILGRSRGVLRLLEHVERVASTPRTTALIQGESGVGKELVARAIHQQSTRSHKPFVAVNCASLSDSMLEAELFGYEAGSFTGANPKGKEGLLAAAEGGTLLLDEIGELELSLQARLLRVLQERVYRRVGGSDDRRMDVRVIASTNRDLEEMVDAGTFREDLFYRLNVMSLRVPPLRERTEDIPVLATHFLETYAREFGRRVEGFADEAMEALGAYPWPGNVRELRNTIERAVLLASSGPLSTEQLALETEPRMREAQGDHLRLPLKDCSLRAMEAELIRTVLQRSDGNRSQAAQVLGVNRTTLYNKIKKYEL